LTLNFLRCLSNDYAAIALDNALSTIDQWILPDQIQLIADLAHAF
jgi:hypothetical protein